jgi:hypothetical protein
MASNDTEAGALISDGDVAEEEDLISDGDVAEEDEWEVTGAGAWFGALVLCFVCFVRDLSSGEEERMKYADGC